MQRRINIGFVRMENSVLRTFMIDGKVNVLDVSEAEDLIPDGLPVNRSFELVLEVDSKSTVDESGGTTVVNSINFVSLTDKSDGVDVPYPKDIGIGVASAFTQLLSEKLDNSDHSEWYLGIGNSSFRFGGS